MVYKIIEKEDFIIFDPYLGEEMVLGNCRRAISTESGETVWDASDHEGTTLLASCTHLGRNGTDYFRAQDCINGTLLPEHILGREPTNLTTLHHVFQTKSNYHFSDLNLKI